MAAPKTTRSRAAGAAVAIAGLLALAACGSSSKSASTSGGQAGAAPTTAAASTSGSNTTAAAGGGAGGTIATRSTPLGTLVVDANGRTLYVFDKDSAGSNTSACTGSCATTWPAASVTGTPTEGSGITGTIGAITRSDGSKQVTLNGRPLYLFSGDQAPGDTHGNGIAGIWHVVLASGAPAPAATTTTAAAGGGGY